MIPNNYTLHALHLNVHKAEHITINELTSNYQMLKTIDSIILFPKSPDDCHFNRELRYRYIQGNDNLVKELTYIPKPPSLSKTIWNPNIIPYNPIINQSKNISQEYLMVTRNYDDPMSLLIVDSDYKYLRTLKITNINSKINNESFEEGIRGGDARMKFLTNDILYMVCGYLAQPSMMKILILQINRNNNTINILNENLLRISDDNVKNWTPFLYNNTIYLIKNINPMEIVNGMPNYSQIEIQNNEIITFSKLSYLKLQWTIHCGHIRGGTGAKLIGFNNGYLGFFHSRIIYDCNAVMTYLMGAYIFSATYPFNLKYISHVPIYHPTFYNTKWSAFKGTDYVVFPIDYYFNDVNDIQDNCDLLCLYQYNITLIIGAQDRDGFSMVINLGELFETLMEIE